MKERAMKVKWFKFSSTPFEVLENRVLMAADVPSINGSGHNLSHPAWGMAGNDLLRLSPAAYADGVSAPSGATRPSARAISNAVAAQSANPGKNDRYLSAFVYAWGQFIDHDLDLTTTATPAESFNVAVPTGDAYFDPNSTGAQVIPLTRSKWDAATGTGVGNPRQQVTDITSWIDGSQIYGSDPTTAASLRAFSGGLLRTSAGNLLPVDTTTGLPMAGDIRAAENPELLSLQTLFVREHNRVAKNFAASNPGASDEQIFQQARHVVIGEIQSITYNEFLPALLGPNAPGAYQGYNANVNPGIAMEFSTAAFRIGHTLVGDDVEFLDNNGNDVHAPMSLASAFFNTSILSETGIGPVLKYLASDNAEEVDTHVVDSLRNFLFGPPGAGGLDLASLNIQRGRDHGLSDYNTTRAAYGLPKVTSFAQITADPAVQQQLQLLYGNVNNVDLWVGGLAERHLPGSSVGETFTRIISDQFRRVRDGDRFWYQNTPNTTERSMLDHTDLADVIRWNTEINNLQDNVFTFRASIGGQVFLDSDKNGRRDLGEPGIGGRQVQLLDDVTGLVIKNVTTRPDGGYVFDGLDLGKYDVRVTQVTGYIATTTPPPAISITRGMAVNNVLFGQVSTGTNQLPPPPPPPPGSGPAPTKTTRLADSLLSPTRNDRLV
jgi:hypothetical protein